jgi:hypothetical protein
MSRPVTVRSWVRDVVRRGRGRLTTWTVVGMVDLDAEGGPRLVVAGIVEGSVVAIDEALSGDGRGRRFYHQVRARSAAAAEAECRAYVTYVHSLTAQPAPGPG